MFAGSRLLLPVYINFVTIINQYFVPILDQRVMYIVPIYLWKILQHSSLNNYHPMIVIS